MTRHLSHAWPLLVLLAGCQPPDPSALTVAVIPKGLTHEHWQSVWRGAERAAADLADEGVRVRVIWDGPLRERDALAQIRIVDRRVSTGVDGIVLAPQHSQTMTAPVARAAAQGVPTVVIDSGLEDPGLYTHYVATDNANGGRLAARRLLQVLRDRGVSSPRIILLRYQVGSEATDRREEGFEAEVEQAIAERQRRGEPPITWLSRDQYAGATVDSASRAAKPLLHQFRDTVDGIFAPNESSANGVVSVLRNMGLNAGRPGEGGRRVVCAGFDASGPLLESIRTGDLCGTIVQDPYRMGYLSTYQLVRHLTARDAGGPSDSAARDRPGAQKSVGTGEHVVTADNLDAPETLRLFRPDHQARRTTAELRDVGGRP